MNLTIEENSEKKCRQLIENSLQGIVIIQDFRIVYANPAFARITGYSVNELLNFTPRQISELAHPDDREMIWSNLKKRLAGFDINPNYQFKGQTKEGKTKILELYANRIDYEGKPAVQGFILDITEQVAARELIDQRTKLIEIILNNIPLGIVVTEIESGKSNFINKEIGEIFGWREDEKPNLQKFINKILLNSDSGKSLSSVIKTDMKEKKPENMFWDNIGIVTKTGDKKFISVKNIPLYDQKLTILTVQDITERIKTEIVLQDSLSEKETLLREIHHRVKNNLQTINSLLDLQADSTNDPEVSKSFKSIQGRIKSMALIHEKLYKSENLERIKAREYINNLVEYLDSTYQAINTRVKIEFDVENLYLNLDSAIPCGLIINELVSNSLKYAFPGISYGKVLVSLIRSGNENLLLKVEDNGIGLPEEYSPENSSTLGLQLVNLLTRQINGSLSIYRNAGTKVSITFPRQAGVEEITEN